MCSSDLEGNPYFYGLSSHENVEIKLYNKANPLKPWKMMGRMHDKYLIADAYCAASVLTQDNEQSLDAFMEKIESGDEKILQTWNEYLDHLAVLISNLRMAYDMDIILGGDVGGVLSDYMIPLGEKVMAYNGFEHDASYMKNCSYKKEASAVGAAKYFFTKHMVEL